MSREPGVIGGSAIAAIVGKSSWRSPFDVWAEATGRLEPKDAAEHMSLGQVLERPILEEYAKREKATDLVLMGNTLVVHPDRPWHTGHPDGDRPVAGILPEAKYVPFGAAKFGDEGTDDVPPEYLIQVAWYMSLMERESAHLIALLPGALRIYNVTRNRKLEEFLLERGYHFYVEHIQSDSPPPVSATPYTAEYIRQNFPSDVEPLRGARPDEVALVRDLAAVKAGMAELAEHAETLENILKITVGKAAGISGPGFKLSYKRSKDGTKLDWKAAFTEILNHVALAATEEGSESCVLLRIIEETVRKYTETKPGARRFLPSGPIFKGEE